LPPYEHTVHCYLVAWIDRPIGSITPAEVDDLHREIARDVAARGQYKGATVANDTMKVLRLLYNWAARRDESMGRNPVRLLQGEWHPVEPVRRPIPTDKLPAFYHAVMTLPDMGRDYLLIALFTGMRRRELGSLRWTNIDWTNKVIRLDAKQTKARRALDLPMSNFVHSLLVARRALGDERGWVFPSVSRTGHIEDPRTWIEAVSKASGVEFSMHDLRRTFVTVAEACDIGTYALKALVNHAQPRNDVTSLYLDLTAERLREPVQKVCDKLMALCQIEPVSGENVTRLR
jgi:integrase